MKTTVIAGAAVILAAGTTTTLIIQHQSQKSPASARYSTPEATLKSYEWALSKGDAKAVLNCFTPEDQKVVKAALQNMPDTVRAGWFPQKEDEIKGSHIASKKVISADEVELTFSNPKYKEPPVRLKKLGDEWKFTGLAKQSNN